MTSDTPDHAHPAGEPVPSKGDTATPGNAAPALNTLRWTDPLRWLALGWRDFIRAPGIGVFYG